MRHGGGDPGNQGRPLSLGYLVQPPGVYASRSASSASSSASMPASTVPCAPSREAVASTTPCCARLPRGLGRCRRDHRRINSRLPALRGRDAVGEHLNGRGELALDGRLRSGVGLLRERGRGRTNSMATAAMMVRMANRSLMWVGPFRLTNRSVQFRILLHEGLVTPAHSRCGRSGLPDPGSAPRTGRP